MDKETNDALRACIPNVSPPNLLQVVSAAPSLCYASFRAASISDVVIKSFGLTPVIRSLKMLERGLLGKFPGFFLLTSLNSGFIFSR